MAEPSTKPNAPGPIERRLKEQVNAGAWYVRLDTYEDFARLHSEILSHHDTKWQAVSAMENPPMWANAMFHGVPLVVGSTLIKAEEFLEAISILKAMMNRRDWSITSPDLPPDIRAHKFLMRMKVPCP